MSAAPSPMSSCSTRPRARQRSPRSPRRAPTSRAVSRRDLGACRRPVDGRCRRPRHHGGDQRALERKGARIGVITTQGCATSWRCAAATGPAPGACAAISAPWCRATCASRCPSARWPTAPSTRPSTSTPCAPRRRSSSTRAARRWRSSSPMPMPIPRTRPARSRRCARSGPTACQLFSEILPEIREFERFSTTALNAYLQPEVSGYIDRLDRALTQGGFGGEFMIVQSNGGVMGTDTACRLPGAHGAVRPGSRRYRSGAHRPDRGVRQCHHRRHGRHQLRRRPDRRRASRSWPRRPPSTSAWSCARR
jgi:hypothetical protein